MLTKGEQIVDTSVDGGSSSNAERTINITVTDNLSSQMMNEEDLCMFNRTIHAATYEGVWDLIEFVMGLVLIIASHNMWLYSLSPCFVLAYFLCQLRYKV